MLTKRIIPCLDVKDGRVVKGQSFVNLRDAGDPVELAALYDAEGADELVFLDISASIEKRKTIIDMVRRTAETISIPFTVGGGISQVSEIKDLLRAGADKISLNSSAVKNPELIKEASGVFGSQCIVVAIDARYNAERNAWDVFTHGGTKNTGLDVLEWAKKAVSLGAGEILLTSMDCDGHKDGFDLKLNNLISENVNVPVIASGGAGSMDDFKEVFTKTNVDAGLAASIFHFGEIRILDLKEFLIKQGVEIRC